MTEMLGAPALLYRKSFGLGILMCFTTPLRVSASFLLGVLLLAITPMVVTAQDECTAPATDPQGEKEGLAIIGIKTIPVDAKDDELKRLLKERFNAAVEELEVRYSYFQAGRSDLDGLVEAGKHLVTAGIELLEDPQERVDFLTKYVRHAKQIEERCVKMSEAGVGSTAEMLNAKYYRADAEIQLLRAKKALANTKGK